jgi:hypothetical protein
MTYELIVQLAGAVGAVQLRLTELEVVAVTARPVGAEETAAQAGAFTVSVAVLLVADPTLLVATA